MKPSQDGVAPAAQRKTSRMKPLDERVAFVTGGARGLGAAICRELAGAGMQIVVVDVREDEAAAVARSLSDSGGRAEHLALDLRDAGALTAAIADTAARLGSLDVLVNNAGIDRTVPIDELSIREWDNIMAVNLRAPFVAARAALPLMRDQGEGHIITIASTAAKRAWPNASAYHASKWGVLGFTHALQTEARPHGIKVTALVSGGMRTPFLLDRFPDIDESTLQEPASVARAVRLLLELPDETVVPELMVVPLTETSWP